MGAGLKHSQQVQIYFWFLLLALMARKECSQQHFLSVLSFSKHQIWCPCLLGWDGVNCLAKKWGGAKARSAISYILLISTFSLQPTAFWNWCSKHAFIFKILFHFQNVLLFSKFHIFEIVDHALALPPIFCQTVNPISTNGAWTPNSKCCWLETKSRNQKDIRNCWLCFSPNPFCFAKLLTLFQPRGLGHQIWCFENESTFWKCFWLHPLSFHGDWK